MYPSVPDLTEEEKQRVLTVFGPEQHYAVPSAAEAAWDPMSGALRQAPWDAPFRDSGDANERSVPGGLGRNSNFWYHAVLVDHPQRDELTGWLRDGVRVLDFLMNHAKGRRRMFRTTRPSYRPKSSQPYQARNSQCGFRGDGSLCATGMLSATGKRPYVHRGAAPTRCHAMGVKLTKEMGCI